MSKNCIDPGAIRRTRHRAIARAPRRQSDTRKRARARLGIRHSLSILARWCLGKRARKTAWRRVALVANPRGARSSSSIRPDVTDESPRRSKDTAQTQYPFRAARRLRDESQKRSFRGRNALSAQRNVPEPVSAFVTANGQVDRSRVRASWLASLLISHIPAVCAFVAPRRPGASKAGRLEGRVPRRPGASKAGRLEGRAPRRPGASKAGRLDRRAPRPRSSTDVGAPWLLPTRGSSIEKILCEQSTFRARWPCSATNRRSSFVEREMPCLRPRLCPRRPRLLRAK